MKLTSLYLLALLLAGCATGNPRAQSRPSAPTPPAMEVAATTGAPSSDASLSLPVEQVREVPRRVPSGLTHTKTVEQWSQGLASAISLLGAEPTVEHEVELGQAYMSVGILDHAYEHFAKAARTDTREGAAWDGLARIWRDWGFPHIGLGDAHRAVWCAPQSPVVRNTLGTILQNLGKGREAREQFTVALAFDPGAAYAQNNICYSWLMEGDTEAAAIACRRALALEPDLIPARNNLALASAIDGDIAGAAKIFREVGIEAAVQYNLGIIYLSQRRHSAAADAFDRAARLQPALVLAGARARQAREHAIDPLEERKP
jgi:Flp pilus assembly protein TadD